MHPLRSKNMASVEAACWDYGGFAVVTLSMPAVTIL
jgi:hypothetical protein